MTRCALILLLIISGCIQTDQEETTTAPLQTERFEFEVEGNRLVGSFDVPTHREPLSTIIIVHGYGKTNVVEQNWYYSLRSQFARIGVNTLMWDKPGCGESEGEFDINQPVQSSAKEVVAAVRALQEKQIPGTDTIGLWGVSRAGWIAPLAIQEESDIAFWISVSGTDDKENARYLIETNLRIEGRPEPEIEMIVSEWQAQFNASWKGGTYQQYLDATPNLKDDDFIKFMGWDGSASEQEFIEYQSKFIEGELMVDEQEELMIYVPNFDQVLSSINRPVLALFGEKDTNVDWRKTAALYRKTIGTNPNASLTITTFPDANHNMKQSETGGVRELLNQGGDTPYAEGYIEAMINWLVENDFGEGPFYLE